MGVKKRASVLSGGRVWLAACFVLALCSQGGLAAAILGGAVELLHWAGPVDAQLDVYAPDLAPVPAARLLLSFVFLQSVHYLVWLRLVPEDDRDRPAPRPFRASWEALRADFGGPALALAGVAALGIAAWGAFDSGPRATGTCASPGFTATSSSPCSRCGQRRVRDGGGEGAGVAVRSG